MALTLEAEQRLTKVSLVDFFDQRRNTWKDMAEETYNFVKEQFPRDSKIRPDDVAKPMLSLLEVNESLKAALGAKKLTQKYWISDFADLILDRTWAEIIAA